MEKINQAGNRPREKRSKEMKELQIYGSKKESDYFVLVDGDGNYSIHTQCMMDDGFTGFRQDGSWMPVRFDDAPAWLQEQIEDFDLFGVDEGGENHE